MANFGDSIKQFLSSSAKFVGKTANSAAETTKFKMNELTNRSNRRELISALGAMVFDRRESLELPADILEVVQQICTLDGDLDVMRADHSAKKAAAAQQHAAEKAERAAKRAAAKAEAEIAKATAAVNVEMPVIEEAAEAAEIPVVNPEAEIPTLNVEPIEEKAAPETEEAPKLNV